jgi:hypothetical protein
LSGLPFAHNGPDNRKSARRLAQRLCIIGPPRQRGFRSSLPKVRGRFIESVAQPIIARILANLRSSSSAFSRHLAERGERINGSLVQADRAEQADDVDDFRRNGLCTFID